RRLTRLLGEFRQFGKETKLECEALDLRELFRETVDKELIPTAGKAVDVVLSLPETLPEVHANRDKLKQVLINLGKNAVEAMPDGGRLNFEVVAEVDTVAISVSDTGAGIADDVDIFQPFMTTKGDGTGLGLPVVRQIVELHGGTIRYSSKLGTGTKFTITLPLRPPSVVPEAPPA
ncbi:MAG: HAMP domain-containing sensor histidine kinase, partial [Myxococcota bacterium]